MYGALENNKEIRMVFLDISFFFFLGYQSLTQGSSFEAGIFNLGIRDPLYTYNNIWHLHSLSIDESESYVLEIRMS